jgi:hypothetical protein
MVGRHKPSGSRPKLIRRPKRRPDVLPNVGLFAGYNDGFALEQDDAFDLAEQFASHDPGDDASGAGEDAVPNDGDDQAGEGAVRSPTGRWALRSSGNGDRLRPGSPEIDADRHLLISIKNDILSRIRDVGARLQEPERYYLAVLVFPEDAAGRVRVVADDMVPTTDVSTGAPRQRPSSPPVAQRGLKLRKRLRVSTRNGDRLRPGGRKIDLDHDLVVDPENDVLRRILDAGARLREPKRYYLGILVFPEDADGWMRVVGDHMTPITEV